MPVVKKVLGLFFDKTGLQGETGIQGLTGIQGETGLQGETGIQGQKSSGIEEQQLYTIERNMQQKKLYASNVREWFAFYGGEELGISLENASIIWEAATKATKQQMTNKIKKNLSDFVKENSNLPTEFSKIINENFWDLLLDTKKV